MSAWNIVILAALICVALKVAGYLIPARAFEHPTVARISNLMTVALLSALIAVQTLGVGQGVQVDARVPALLVAAVLYAVRVPFVLVVIAAAATAALIRAVT